MDKLREQLTAFADKLDVPKKYEGRRIAAVLSMAPRRSGPRGSPS